MRTILLCALFIPIVSPAQAEDRAPIIDMHLHALAADDQGPPPVAICTPIDPFPTWDPAQPYGATFMNMLKNPPCKDPVWSPMTDKAVMTETLAVMKRRNIYGVLSGNPERVAAGDRETPRKVRRIVSRRHTIRGSMFQRDA